MSPDPSVPAPTMSTTVGDRVGEVASSVKVAIAGSTIQRTVFVSYECRGLDTHGETQVGYGSGLHLFRGKLSTLTLSSIYKKIENELNSSHMIKYTITPIQILELQPNDAAEWKLISDTSCTAMGIQNRSIEVTGCYCFFDRHGTFTTHKFVDRWLIQQLLTPKLMDHLFNIVDDRYLEKFKHDHHRDGMAVILTVTML